MTDLETRIVEHYRANPGVNVNWATLGTDYYAGVEAFESLLNKGILVQKRVPSKSGKTMQLKTFLAD